VQLYYGVGVKSTISDCLVGTIIIIISYYFQDPYLSQITGFLCIGQALKSELHNMEHSAGFSVTV